MKRIISIIFTLSLALGATTLSAQITGNGKVVASTGDLPFFNAIDAGGALNITLVQAEKNQILVETDENLLPLVNYRVSNGTLKITMAGFRSATKLQLTVFFKEMNLIEISGAAKINTDGPINTDMLALKFSGASSANIELAANKLQTNISGAAKVNLTGSADHHTLEMSGASKLTAAGLRTLTTVAELSGAADAYVNTAEFLSINTTGVAKLRYEGEPARIERKETTGSNNPAAPPSKPSGDTVSVTVGNVNIKVIDGDSTIVELGNRRLVVDEKGNVSLKRQKRNKFNGHWAGVELGVNGFVTPGFGLNMPYNYLDLQYDKSVAVNLNFYEQNIPLNARRTFGIVSGLGLSWNNYRFEDNVLLRNENKSVRGYYIQGVGMKKSKLVNSYLTLPLLFELQTNASKRREKAHIALGVVGGWRFSSHSKIYFLEPNKPYVLKDEDGNVVPGTWISPGASSRNIVKDHNGFQQNPFKLDATVRAGWGVVNLFANYSLTPMFIKDRGPELYPFTVGFTLTAF